MAAAALLPAMLRIHAASARARRGDVDAAMLVTAYSAGARHYAITRYALLLPARLLMILR